MQNRLSHLGILVLILVSMVFGVLGGVALDRVALALFAQLPSSTTNQTVDTHLISEAWDLIDRSYVDRAAVQSKELTYAAIRGMMDALGDTGHSRFLTPQLVQERNNSMHNISEGIGVSVEIKDGHTVIVAFPDGSPAQKAGLKPGDIILAVDGVSVNGMSITQVEGRILGPADSSVRMAIQDPQTGGARDVTIRRARIMLHNVTWAFIPGTTIAEIRIAHFSQGVAKDFQNALTAATTQGVTGIILDLRNDSGGSTDEAVGVASQFLKNGNVFEEQDAQSVITKIPVKSGGVALETPVVVLVNHSTASSSEIVASALQDARRARLVGGTTFGTGTVLKQFDLRDGSALLLATHEWLTPSGRSFWHKGIMPDVSVTLPPNASPVIPGKLSHMTLTEFQASADVQLFKGMELLGQPPLKSP